MRSVAFHFSDFRLLWFKKKYCVMVMFSGPA